MNIISIVFKKELKDMFRDKKTLIIGILLPLLMYPVLFGIMGKGMDSQTKDVEKEVKVVMVDKTGTDFGKYLKTKENMKFIEADNISEAVKEGDAYLAIEIPENVDKDIKAEKPVGINISYDSTSTKSNTAMGIIDSYIKEYSQIVVAQRLKVRNIDTSILQPINLVAKDIDNQKDGMGKMILGMMLPMMIIMFAASGPISSAVDLGAGEKERGTLEPLLTTQANRTSLLWGKFLAITVMGMLTSVAFIAGLVISMKKSPGMFGDVTGGMAIGTETLILVAVFTIALTMVFGALALAISIYARSFKEAQTYLTPLNFIGFIGFTSYMIDVKTVSLASLNIPIYNVTVVLKEATLGIFNTTHIALVLVWTCIYILASILFARYMFSREDAIFRS